VAPPRFEDTFYFAVAVNGVEASAYFPCLSTFFSLSSLCWIAEDESY